MKTPVYIATAADAMLQESRGEDNMVCVKNVQKPYSNLVKSKFLGSILIKKNPTETNFLGGDFVDNFTPIKTKKKTAQTRAKEIVELRDEHHLSFEKIAAIYRITRQWANIIYHNQKPDAPRRPRRFKKEEITNADHQN